MMAQCSNNFFKLFSKHRTEEHACYNVLINVLDVNSKAYNLGYKGPWNNNSSVQLEICETAL
jgi:hypothetical protein